MFMTPAFSPGPCITSFTFSMEVFLNVVWMIYKNNVHSTLLKKYLSSTILGVLFLVSSQILSNSSFFKPCSIATDSDQPSLF